MATPAPHDLSLPMAPESTDCLVCRSWAQRDFNKAVPEMNFLVEIIASAQTGCLYCQFFLDVLRLEHPDDLRPESPVDLQALQQEGRTYFGAPLWLWSFTGPIFDTISFSLHYKVNDILAPKWQNVAEPAIENLASIIFGGASLAVAKSSASADAFARAGEWLSHCVGNHPRCGADRGQHDTGPRRLLSVAAASSRWVQLVEFDGSAAWPEYACLSYRWGDDLEGVLTTTRQSLDEHLVGICEEKLPKAITDAIQVCRELAIPYLWVDALCILQQDDVDFAIEGSKMDTIYANSHLTIYAKHSDSCKDGFLGPQLYGQPEWQYVAPFPSTPKRLPFFVRRGEPITTPFSLDSRGWCLQESILPSRQLIYTGEEMVWRCNTHGLCECGHIVGIEANSEGFDSRYASHFLENAKGISGQPIKSWENTIREYSSRSLTNPQDRLAAISGLAKRELAGFSAPSAHYVAGLLKEGLPDQLLWILNHDDFMGLLDPPFDDWESAHGQRLLNGTPTWSWASVQGRIDFLSFPQLDYVSPCPRASSAHSTALIDSISCIPSHPQNPMGPVKAGLLVLTAPVLPVWLAVHKESQSSFAIGAEATVVSRPNEDCPLWTHWISPDLRQPLATHDKAEYCKRIPRNEQPPGHRHFCDCKLHLWSKPHLACGIRRYEVVDDEERDPVEELGPDTITLQSPSVQACRMHFLLLETTPDEGVYRRVGVVSGGILRTIDGEDPVGGGDGAEKLFWETQEPKKPRWEGSQAQGAQESPTRCSEVQRVFKTWPSRVELEWKQVRII